MKSILSISILLVFSNLFSQTKETKIIGLTVKNRNEVDTTQVRINSTFFLLGTLNDYISHNIYQTDFVLLRIYGLCNHLKFLIEKKCYLF